MEPELIDLHKDHAAFLAKPKKDKEAVASFSDSSIANLSSVVLLAEVGAKRNSSRAMPGETRFLWAWKRPAYWSRAERCMSTF